MPHEQAPSTPMEIARELWFEDQRAKFSSNILPPRQFGLADVMEAFAAGFEAGTQE